MKEDNTSPLQWPTAVIHDIYPGKDGIIRVVTIKPPREYLNSLQPKFVPYRVLVESKTTFFPAGSMFTRGTEFWV